MCLVLKRCFIIKHVGFFLFVLFCVFSRYVSIKPDSRKLANGTNVLGLLIDTLLMEGFHLVGNRTVSSEDKTEYFERIKRPEALAMNKTVKPVVAIMPAQSQEKK